MLLIVLWVRSYWWMDTLKYPHIASVYGRIFINEGIVFYDNRTLTLSPCGVRSYPLIGVKVQPMRRGTEVPFWALVPPAFVLTVTPWLRLGFQFSLRTLLIATTAIAVVLGLAVWSLR